MYSSSSLTVTKSSSIRSLELLNSRLCDRLLSIQHLNLAKSDNVINQQMLLVKYILITALNVMVNLKQRFKTQVNLTKKIYSCLQSDILQRRVSKIVLIH